VHWSASAFDPPRLGPLFDVYDLEESVRAERELLPVRRPRCLKHASLPWRGDLPEFAAVREIFNPDLPRLVETCDEPVVG
jgi:hypothetical protein